MSAHKSFYYIFSISAIAISLSLTLFISAGESHAAGLPVDSGFGPDAEYGDQLNQISKRDDINPIIEIVSKWFISIVGLTTILALVYGGYLYITSMGESGRTETAKDVVTYAAIGLVVVLIAYVILQTVNCALVPIAPNCS